MCYWGNRLRGTCHFPGCSLPKHSGIAEWTWTAAADSGYRLRPPAAQGFDGWPSRAPDSYSQPVPSFQHPWSQTLHLQHHWAQTHFIYHSIMAISNKYQIKEILIKFREKLNIEADHCNIKGAAGTSEKDCLLSALHSSIMYSSHILGSGVWWPKKSHLVEKRTSKPSSIDLKPCSSFMA